MAELARSKFEVLEPLLDDKATFRALQSHMEYAAGKLKGGGLLLVTYAGHGCQLRNVEAGNERDGYDETWCLADEEVRDDRLHALLGLFDEGVRILIISDSCHSGGLRFAGMRGFAPPDAVWHSIRQEAITRQLRSGWDPPAELYDLLLPRDVEQVHIRASVLLIASCQDNQKAEDGEQNGLFTQELLKVWAKGAFSRRYPEFIREIRDAVSSANGKQHPGIAFFGTANPAFLRERPFRP